MTTKNKLFVGGIIIIALIITALGIYFLYKYVFENKRIKELFDELDSCRADVPTISSYALRTAFAENRVGLIEVDTSTGSEFDGVLGGNKMKGIETFVLGQEGHSYVGSNKMLPYGTAPADPYMAQYSFVPFDYHFMYYPYRRYVRSNYQYYLPGKWMKHFNNYYWVL